MHENSRKTNESESDQSELHGESSQEKKGTTYLEQNYEEFGEVTILTSIYLPTQFVIHLSTAFFTLFFPSSFFYSVVKSWVALTKSFARESRRAIAPTRICFPGQFNMPYSNEKCKMCWFFLHILNKMSCLWAVIGQWTYIKWLTSRTTTLFLTQFNNLRAHAHAQLEETLLTLYNLLLFVVVGNLESAVELKWNMKKENLDCIITVFAIVPL